VKSLGEKPVGVKKKTVIKNLQSEKYPFKVRA